MLKIRRRVGKKIVYYEKKTLGLFVFLFWGIVLLNTQDSISKIVSSDIEEAVYENNEYVSQESKEDNSTKKRRKKEPTKRNHQIIIMSRLKNLFKIQQ